MTQPDFDFTAPTEKRPHKRVRDTSKEAYAIGRQVFSGRKANALRHLAAYWNRFQESPTAAELTTWVDELHHHYTSDHFKVAVLTMRRGLSDLKADGIAIPGFPRRCMVTNRYAETWRVREVGSEESR